MTFHGESGKWQGQSQAAVSLDRKLSPVTLQNCDSFSLFTSYRQS